MRKWAVLVRKIGGRNYHAVSMLPPTEHGRRLAQRSLEKLMSTGVLYKRKFDEDSAFIQLINVNVSDPWSGAMGLPEKGHLTLHCCYCGATFFDNHEVSEKLAISCPWCGVSHYEEIDK